LYLATLDGRTNLPATIRRCNTFPPIPGTVTFKDGSTTLGSTSVDSSGNATLTTSALAAGSHSVSATYSGDIDFAGSTSPAAVEVISAPTGGASIADLLSRVAGLNLNAGQKNSLSAKLRAAQDSLNRGNHTSAANQLNAFINEVEALQQSGQLDPSTANSLIAEAQAVIGLL
jgi:hypothetical protein